MTKSIKSFSRRTALGVTLSGVAVSASAQSIWGDIFKSVISSDEVKNLSAGDASLGIREALTQGVGNAVDTLGQVGGFLLDNAVRIPLPGFLGDVQSTLSSFGMSGELDELETELNRGAETAVPLARDIFVGAITDMTIEDALGIVQGPANSATQYLSNKTTPILTDLFSPVMRNALQGTGAIQTLDEVAASMDNIPFVAGLSSDASTDLVAHGVKYGLRGVFHYIGEEEAAIRNNPAARGSEILEKVFG